MSFSVLAGFCLCSKQGQAGGAVGGWGGKKPLQLALGIVPPFEGLASDSVERLLQAVCLVRGWMRWEMGREKEAEDGEKLQ